MTDPLSIGEIRIAYTITENGHPEVQMSLPDVEDIDTVTQLGLLEMAKHTVISGEDDG